MRLFYPLFGVLCFLFSVSAYAIDVNFVPSETIAVTGATSSANAAFSLSQSGVNTQDVLATNTSTTIAATVTCGSGSATAATLTGVGMIPVLPGEIVLIHKGTANYCAAITASSTAIIDFTSGQGN